MDKKKSIAVIGGGSCGLAAIKACKEEGFAVTCFERSGGIGGLWNFGEANATSTMSFTVINTHKEMSAFSDFPPPAHFPNYLHNSQVLRYFTMYAERFDLLPCVRFRREVLAVERCQDYAQTGRWKVRVRRLDEGGEEEEETFDGVMVCTGHHVQPRLPSGIPGLNAFGGTVLHSQALKHAETFKGKEVLVVGIGNSGVDAAVEISHVAKQVYLSTRSGSWVVPRSGPCGLPLDTIYSNRFVQFCIKVLGWRLISLIGETLVVNQFFDHSLYGLKPKHRLLSQHPTINDTLPSKILSGRVLVRGDVERFTEKGVVFEGGDVVPVDAVVFATGYKVELPFVDFLNPVDNHVDLYKMTFPPSLEHPTFALIGMTQPLGCIFPIAEAQSRWFCQLLAGKCRLPCLPDMQAEVLRRRQAMRDRYVDSPRHTLQVDYVSFMDDINSEFGARPDLLRLLLTDPLLFLTCLFGPCLSYQYRLQGPHASPESARKLLMTYPSRVVAPLKSGLSSQHYGHYEFFRILYPILLPLLFLVLVWLVIL